MKNSLLILFFSLPISLCLAQFNPEKPNLMQRAFYTEAQAVTVHQDLAKLYTDKTSWEKRAKMIRQGILDGAEIKKISHRKPKNITIHSKKVLNGYVVENVSFESLKGIYVTGNLYTPLSKDAKKPVVLCPHGHGPDPRFKEYTQQRCATLARMGAVVFAYDMVGVGDSKYCDHKIEKAFKLQLINSLAAVNFVSHLPNIDKKRIAVTGESGGGTQTFMLAAVDERIAVSVPVVMVSVHFFGGCVCESGMPIHKRPTHQTSNVEIAALIAPKPMLLISDGDDWTKHTPEVEFPHIQRIYSFFNAPNRVENAHFPTEKHDYGANKRQAAYVFLAKHLGLNIEKVMKNGKVDESENAILTPEDLAAFTKEHPRPSGAVSGNEAVAKILE
ncbi:MAG: acetylxylan esterase [Saprospiraceae bacterium]|nr:acetylxylan esterase [Saprospiraceae bacterium]